MSRDNTYLVDILESAKIALDYVFDKDWDAFYTDIQVQDAAVRRIEIIGRPQGGFRKKHVISIRKFPGVK